MALFDNQQNLYGLWVWDVYVARIYAIYNLKNPPYYTVV